MEVEYYLSQWRWSSAPTASVQSTLTPLVIKKEKGNTLSNNTLQTIKDVSGVETHVHDYSLDTYLEGKIDKYALVFNTLPPGKRLIVSSLDIDTPIVDVNYASDEKLKNADFHEELQHGVVRYPFTWKPSDTRASHPLIFGHSSVDGWENVTNNFWYIFSQLPKLSWGEHIEVIWDGKKYTYAVEDKVIVKPDEVWTELQKHQNDNYLTLMACYPLFSTAKRIMVRTKMIESDDYTKKLYAYNNEADDV